MKCVSWISDDHYYQYHLYHMGLINKCIMLDIYTHDIDGLVQDYSIIRALAMEILQSCTKPSNYNIDIEGFVQVRRNCIAKALELHLDWSNPTVGTKWGWGLLKLSLLISLWWKSLICKNTSYRKTSNISHTSVGDEIVDNSDVIGASPVGAAPATSSFST